MCVQTEIGSHSYWIAGSLDPLPVSRVPLQLGSLNNMTALGFVDGALVPQPKDPRDCLPFAPIEDLIQWDTFAAPSIHSSYVDDPDSQYLAVAPQLVMRSMESLNAAGNESGTDVYNLEILYTRPSWATMKITGHILASSLCDTGHLAPLRREVCSQQIRLRRFLS